MACEYPSPPHTSLLTPHQTLGKFFQPGDFIIGETGTSAFGLADSKLPSGATMFNQTIFGSIGYATGAALGAFKAIREIMDLKLGYLDAPLSLRMTTAAVEEFNKRKEGSNMGG